MRGSRSCWRMRTWTTTSSSRRLITWEKSEPGSAAVHVQRDVGVSERRACRALDQPRTTQRYQRRPKADEAALLKAIEDLVCQHPRYGYRMIHGMLVADGLDVGRDRVYRFWRSQS